MRKTPNISLRDKSLLSSFPADPDTATRAFQLDGQETIHAVCPNSKCHKIYPPTFLDRSPIPIYPTYCSHKEFNKGSECGTRLTRPKLFGNVNIEVPIKRFVTFSFKDFVARLTARPSFEDLMDAPRSVTQEDEQMRDIFDGQFLQHFKGPDGLAFRSDIQAGRYCFSLCVDFFNPFTNKQAGKKVSVGIISVVCISLLASLQYKPENMFLAGVVPGPNEPPLTAINHYLTPLIDEFSVFWDPGVKFSQTFNYPEGRLILCALVLVICDLLGAQKTAGFAACSHEYFCSICLCVRSRHGYKNTDYHNWTRRTNTGCREAANRYWNASSPDAQLEEFNKTGIRWSELLRLPYFDIARCVVVDSMHNLFLGLIKEHFMGILGIGLPTYHERPVISLTFGVPPETLSNSDKKGVNKLKTWLEAPAATTFSSDCVTAIKKLKRINLPALRFVCSEVNCSLPAKPRLTKADYVECLLDWVSYLWLNNM